MSEGKFKEYKAAVDPLIKKAPEVDLQVQASFHGSIINVNYNFSKAVPGTDYHVVLVQGEEEYQGSNGLKYHKMVVRDLITIDSSAAKTTRFDLSASEQATDSYLTEFAKTYKRIPNFKWSVRHNKIARKGLKVVFFAQDKVSKRVLNAVITDVN